MKSLITTIAGICAMFLLPSGLSAQDCSADFTVSIDGPTATFDGTVTGDMPYFSWSFGDGTYAFTEDPEHTYMYDGVYLVCLSVLAADSCVATYCDSIEISGAGGMDSTACAAYFYYSVDAGTVYFTDASDPGGADDVFYFWDFGDGSTSTSEDPVHEYAPGWYTVCLDIVTTDSCTSSYCIDIDIIGIIDSGTCSAGFYTAIDGFSADFTNASYGGMGAIITYSWNFGDGGTSALEDPEHTYAVAGAYNVCLSILTSDSCTSSYCSTLVISEGGDTTGILCDASFTYAFGLPANTVLFTNTSDPGTDPTPAYMWDFGDGGTSTAFEPEHIFAADGYYNVCLTIFSDSCTDTYCDVLDIATMDVYDDWEKQVKIYPNPARSYIYLETAQTSELHLSILDPQGRIVQEEQIQSAGNAVSISLAELQSGLYMLRLTDQNGMSVSKMIQILR